MDVPGNQNTLTHCVVGPGTETYDIPLIITYMLCCLPTAAEPKQAQKRKAEAAAPTETKKGKGKFINPYICDLQLVNEI